MRYYEEGLKQAISVIDLNCTAKTNVLEQCPGLKVRLLSVTNTAKN